MEKLQKKILELEILLNESKKKNQKLENEIKELRNILSKQILSQDSSRISSEWLKKEEIKEDDGNGRYRSKTIIESSVIENLRILKEEIQLKVCFVY